MMMVKTRLDFSRTAGVGDWVAGAWAIRIRETARLTLVPSLFDRSQRATARKTNPAAYEHNMSAAESSFGNNRIDLQTHCHSRIRAPIFQSNS
jgi:hypothetical protein